MNISSLTLWHLPLTGQIAYNIFDGKICDTVTSCILRLESKTGLTGWGDICQIPHYLPAYANGVALALTEIAPIFRDMSGRTSTYPRRPATTQIIPSTAHGIGVNPDFNLLGTLVLKLSA